MSDWCLDCGGYFGISWLYDQSKEICHYTFLEILLSRLSLGQSPCPAPCLRRSWTTSSTTARRCLRRSSSQSVSYFPSTVQFLLPIQQFLLQELLPEVSSSRCSWHTTLRLAWRRWSLWPPGRERTSHMKEPSPSPCYGYFRHDVGCCAWSRGVRLLEKENGSSTRILQQKWFAFNFPLWRNLAFLTDKLVSWHIDNQNARLVFINQGTDNVR